jgi:hypothetical protein
MKKSKRTQVATGDSGQSNLAAVKPVQTQDSIEPQMTAFASEERVSTMTRRNVAGSIERTSRFTNIDEGMTPFRHSSSIYGDNRASIDVRDAVVLCQKCYYNFALFRNIIDLMTEFSSSPLVFKGGSQQSRDFFTAFFAKINIWDLQDKFFREYYRSGNVFIYRFDADIKPADIRKITQVFAEEKSSYLPQGYEKINPQELQVEPMKLPARYIILNPADIQMMSTLNFAYGIYFKILSDYEIAQLRQPKSEEDIAVFNELPKEVQEQIKTGARTIAIPLNPKRISMVFYKKQDYEPFAVPMGYPVLEDINFKAELRKIDMAISRTMQQIVLLVTAGNEPEKHGINQKYIDSLRKLFSNQSVGRVLVADYTTKASFVIPQIGDLLDPKKYQIVNEDINIGLNNVFAGGDKFANQQQKVEIFISRLQQGRMAFLHNFLIPEIRRIAKSLNFKNYPTPEFEDFELKDNSTMNKIFSRLMEMGILTPEQGFKALRTGILPDASLAVEEQKDYMKKRDSGLYTPLIGGPKEEEGRPAGSKAPQTTKKVKPIGSKSKGSLDELDEETPTDKFSVIKVRENLLIAQELEKAVGTVLKDQHKIRKLSKLQKEVADDIVELIMANEEPAEWIAKAKSYCENPVDVNHERVLTVNAIAATHQIDNYLAGVLLASKVS